MLLNLVKCILKGAILTRSINEKITTSPGFSSIVYVLLLYCITTLRHKSAGDLRLRLQLRTPTIFSGEKN